MSDGLKLALAALLVAALAAWGVHGGGLGDSTARRAQEKLQQRVNERLLGVGAEDWARATMIGQRAYLAGVAPSELDLAAARGAVRAAVWTGGPLIGGVTSIHSDDVRIWTPRQGPYAWRAELDLNRLRLAGAIPSRETGAELVALAGALFADRRVINDQIVDPLPPGEGWAEAARAALAVLSHLAAGEAALSDFELTVSGEASDAENAEAAERAIARLEGVVSAASSADVRAPPPRASAAPSDDAPSDDVSSAPDDGNAEAPPPATALSTLGAAPLDLSPRPTEGVAGACQARLDDTLAGASFLFDVNSADISEGSAPLLAEIARIVADCEPLTLRIEGHTDDTGVPAINQSLSERRARAVVDRLVELGVARARMSWVGFGATRPVADNDSDAGRRSNRRIEIIVTP